MRTVSAARSDRTAAPCRGRRATPFFHHGKCDGAHGRQPPFQKPSPHGGFRFGSTNFLRTLWATGSASEQQFGAGRVHKALAEPVVHVRTSRWAGLREVHSRFAVRPRRPPPGPRSSTRRWPWSGAESTSLPQPRNIRPEVRTGWHRLPSAIVTGSGSRIWSGAEINGSGLRRTATGARFTHRPEVGPQSHCVAGRGAVVRHC